MKRLFFKTGLLCLFSTITCLAWGQTDVTATWDFSNVAASAEPGDMQATFSDGTSDYFKSSYIQQASDVNLAYKGTNNTNSAWFIEFQPDEQTGAADDNVNAVDFLIGIRKGMSFTPTSISFNAMRYGTDGGAIDVVWMNADGTTVTLATGQTPNRNNNSVTSSYSYAISNATASSGYCGLRIYIYNLGNTKQIGIGDVVINGTVNGELVEVPIYTLALTVSPEDAGTVKHIPGGSTFEEGDEVTLKQTRNSGYIFDGWADESGNILSTDDSYTITMSSDMNIIAQYSELVMYALTVTLDDSGANDYMITAVPEATVIDGQNMYEAGTVVTLTATSNKILTFASWSNGETSATTTVTMDQDQTISANYSAIDFIAGWDFYKSGSSGRVADFAAEDNDADALVLRTDDGTASGWLDKSEENAGGYEGKPAAVNWRTTGLGDYYWQTKVNASAFTDIKVSSSMLVNYNSYTVYNVQYSLDESTWETIGTITIEGTKDWTDGEFDVPAVANNAPELSIRWYPDRSSDIIGTSSDNDGIAIAEIYITGTEQLVDDGTAPELVSSVPEEGATTASANGKIVLTFDEKVKVTSDDVTATLGDMTLTPTVSGKTVMFNYKGLEYSTEYTFTLPGNSIADLTDNTIADAITINFTTKTKPTVTKKLYDFIVPDDGTITEAFAAAAARDDNSVRFHIFVKQGDYVIPASETATVTGTDGVAYPSPITTLSSPNVSIIGEDMDLTSFVNTVPDNLSTGANPIEGLHNNETFNLTSNATNTYLQDITLKNGFKDGSGRGGALEDASNKTICKNVCLFGYQDTYLSNNESGKFYFEGGKLRGRTDFLCGKGDAFYNAVELVMCESGGYIAVPSTPKQYGYVFRDCTINGEGNISSYTLGRPWGNGTPIDIYINTTMNIIPSAEGWSEMSGGWPERFAEYNSMTSTGTAIDLSNRKTIFADTHENNPILTAEEAELYTIETVMGADDDWDPTEATEQASAPTNVTISGSNLAWDNNDYVLCWAICQDGKVIDFTIDNSYTVSDASATYSVRAANEMGGLGEATVAEVAGIRVIENAENGSVLRSSFYNLQGARVSNSYKGVVIKVDTMSDGKQIATKLIK